MRRTFTHTARRCAIGLLWLIACVSPDRTDHAGAALLDDEVTPLEKRLAERGETVTVGNFLHPGTAGCARPRWG